MQAGSKSWKAFFFGSSDASNFMAILDRSPNWHPWLRPFVLVALLDEKASDHTWVLVAIGANQASGYQLVTGDPVMAIGGFNGTDPTPTLAAFQDFVSNGKIHYFVAGGTGGAGSDAGRIRTWVEANFTKVTIGPSTLYDLTAPLG